MRPYLLIFLLGLLSCGHTDEPTVVTEEGPALTGRWELAEARRDNVKTGTLDGFYLVFQADSTLHTNLMTGEQDQEGTYVVEGDRIVTENVQLPLTYEVRELSEERLLLRARYQGVLFDFTMRRAGDNLGGSPHHVET